MRIKQGSIVEGLQLLDEAMVGVTAILSRRWSRHRLLRSDRGCEEAFEVRRAQEWTDALTRWCDGQPQMVSFTGRCLAHQAGSKQLHGESRDALAEAKLARERCEEAMNRAATGQALYQQGELHRLQEISSAPSRQSRGSAVGGSRSPGWRSSGSPRATSKPRLQ